MFKFISTLSAAVLAGVVVVSPAMAQQTGNQAPKPVEATLSVFQVGKSAEGKEALLPADMAGLLVELRNKS